MTKLKPLGLLFLMFAFEANPIAQTRTAPLRSRSAGPFAVDAVSTSSWPRPSLVGTAPTDGDPIDLYSGLYVRTTVDLSIDDTIPISLERTYRNGDHFSRSFGVGTSHPYDMFIVGDGVTFSYADLIMADGAPIHFERISPGTGYADAVFEHTSTPTSFYGARLAWNGSGWTVTLKDGSYYKLRGCTPKATRPGECGVIEYRDRDGQILHINRDAKGNITRIVSPHREWIAFTYDEYDRVTSAAASTEASVTYEYDDKAHLVRVQPSGRARLSL
jgi:YD repeat-containing protein